MKTKYCFSILSLALILLTSCENTDPKNDTYQDVKAVESIDPKETEESVIIKESIVEGLILTVYGFLDGPDEEFYTSLPDPNSDINEFEFNTLHIVPFNGSKFDSLSNEIDVSMLALITENFKLFSPFDEQSMKVEVFYNQSKSQKMMSYNCKNGNPMGVCSVYSPTGKLYIERIFEQGEWVSSTKEPYSVDWNFNQEKSSLEINDDTRTFTYEGPNEIVSIMPTFNKGDENNLYKIIEKKSFKDTFKVNGFPFTGTLRAYNQPKRFDEKHLYYELNFRQGWLDGNIVIYDDWGGLELHETFINGVLDSTLFQADYSDGVAKPIIYFYPEKDMLVDVKLKFDGRLTHTYPKYNNGWQVYAKTDGTLYDKSKQEYYALYWEGQANSEFTIDEGFVVEGKNTITFLEKSLATLGLNRKEANEFIIYWLPQMENNPYNLIHFSTTQYKEMAKLTITPKPETLIRVMMVFKPLNTKIVIPLQDLSKLQMERKGFTVVEWGGKRISKSVQLDS